MNVTTMKTIFFWDKRFELVDLGHVELEGKCDRRSKCARPEVCRLQYAWDLLPRYQTTQLNVAFRFKATVERKVYVQL